MIITKNNSIHYTWGINCEGWRLLQTNELSIIEERMPPGTKEVLHYHNKVQQFFYILSGTASFTVDGETFLLNAGESIHIKPSQKHFVKNNDKVDLYFLLVSHPMVQGDRFEI